MHEREHATHPTRRCSPRRGTATCTGMPSLLMITAELVATINEPSTACDKHMRQAP